MAALTVSEAVRSLLNRGWTIEPTSCACGGLYAWFKPHESGAQESVGCICHTDVIAQEVFENSEAQRKWEAYFAEKKASV